MISALKKLGRKNEDAKARPSMPTGISSMGQSLQRKFGRGVQYNMKIVIKGDRNTGKSTLLGRFQGKAFREEYMPTNEIQVCSINWSYRVADDVVKVEVWDVVDKGKKKKSDGDGLKLANDASASDDHSPGVLDAEFLDVYKGTHGCVMILDITKQWTFKYIERELPKVPLHIPVLILSNFLDMQEHRVVQREEILSFIKYYDRGSDAAILQHGECSMKNGFGLKFIHKFFNIPFLKLQRETLEKQLETNKEDMQATLEELAFRRDTEEQDYDKFLAYMEKKANDKKQPKQDINVKSSPSTPPKSSISPVQNPPVTTNKASVKKPAEQPKSIDDFVPDETIDSGFLDETDKGSKNKNVVSSESDSSGDSDNEKNANPMVAGFQDISSEDEDNTPDTQQKVLETAEKPNTSFDVDIELTSDESEEEETGVAPVSDDESKNREEITEPAKPLVSETKYEVMLNDEDNNFMDAWLDSPSTDPREISAPSRKKGEQSKNELDIFEAMQLTSPANTSVADDDNSSSNVEEKKKKRSEKKESKEVEDRKHRSKHKHKKKSKTKESNGEMEQSDEKKHKSKKKSRHKDTKDRQKVAGTGAEYESF
ncbi:rab-like protein 6 isoform X2 [Dendronephthya gigantea]|uniref:rab-like protein 6 isoform X2 n=1 Tax=Dendronephthya gigantea TaxID=151771 RepID=UPI00106C6819|nr:rab-like protein 6 isoform X2 [Dendronephthya gigantea]